MDSIILASGDVLQTSDEVQVQAEEPNKVAMESQNQAFKGSYV